MRMVLAIVLAGSCISVSDVALSRELGQILKNYNALLDRYLAETVTSLVAVKGPTIGWGFSLPLLFAGVLVLCAFLALFWVVLDHIVVSAVRRAR